MKKITALILFFAFLNGCGISPTYTPRYNYTKFHSTPGKYHKQRKKDVKRKTKYAWRRGFKHQYR